MALTRNGRTAFINSAVFGGVQQQQRGNYIKGGLKNRFVGGFDSTFGGYNNGTSHPSAFVLPLKAGSISSYNQSRMAITNVNALAYMGRALEASATLAIIVQTADLDQIVALVASGVLQITAASANLSAGVLAVGSSTMTITVTSSTLGGIVPVTATATLILTPAVTMTAQAFMDASAGGPTALSPEGLANAILDALLADHNASGTVGEALNSIGAAGNPWSSTLAANNAAGSFGEKVQKLLEKNTYVGLK